MKKIINKIINRTSFVKTSLNKILGLILITSIFSFSANAQKPAGLNNLGNYCYMNAVVQCLANIQALREVLIADKANLAKDPILASFTNLIELIKTQTTIQNPKSLFDSQGAVFFRPSNTNPNNPKRMQDSEEFLTYLLERLPKNAQKIFTTSIGITQNSKAFATEQDLAEIDHSPKILKLQNNIPFEKGIDDFFNNGKIPKGITELPKILILRLGREKELRGEYIKDNDPIPFQVNNLDLQKYLIDPEKEPTEYDLIGIVCHTGASFSAGHYYSYVKDSEDNSWYRCDDPNVQSVNLAEIEKIAQAGLVNTNDTPYILFYQLKNDKKGPPPEQQMPQIAQKEPVPPEQEKKELAAEAIEQGLAAILKEQKRQLEQFKRQQQEHEETTRRLAQEQSDREFAMQLQQKQKEEQRKEEEEQKQIELQHQQAELKPQHEIKATDIHRKQPKPPARNEDLKAFAKKSIQANFSAAEKNNLRRFIKQYRIAISKGPSANKVVEINRKKINDILIKNNIPTETSIDEISQWIE